VGDQHDAAADSLLHPLKAAAELGLDGDVERVVGSSAIINSAGSCDRDVESSTRWRRPRALRATPDPALGFGDADRGRSLMTSLLLRCLRPRLTSCRCRHGSVSGRSSGPEDGAEVEAAHLAHRFSRRQSPCGASHFTEPRTWAVQQAEHGDPRTGSCRTADSPTKAEDLARARWSRENPRERVHVTAIATECEYRSVIRRDRGQRRGRRVLDDIASTSDLHYPVPAP